MHSFSHSRSRKHNLNPIVKLKTEVKEANIKSKMKASHTETGESSKTPTPAAGINRGMSVLDVILRIVAIASTLASAVVMATSDQQLQFFTQVAVFNVEYEDFSTLRYL